MYIFLNLHTFWDSIFLGSTMPPSYINSLPETLEELYIQRDSVYPFSTLSFPNLWLVSFNSCKPYSISEELINKPSVKNIEIGDTLTYADIESLAKILQLDTLTLVWNKKNPLQITPQNQNKRVEYLDKC
jgi:hypothetical protein